METIQEIAQWVINNRYPKSENDKVSDAEMYQTLIEAMSRVSNHPLVSVSNNDETAEEYRRKLTDKYIETHCGNYTDKEKSHARNAVQIGWEICITYATKLRNKPQ